MDMSESALFALFPESESWFSGCLQRFAPIEPRSLRRLNRPTFLHARALVECSDIDHLFIGYRSSLCWSSAAYARK